MMTRQHIHGSTSIGEKVADAVVKALGSWFFILAQAGILFLWFLLNSVRWFYHFDNYPFILCNLFMSAEAAFASPLILMAANRQADRDRVRDNIEADEVEGLAKSHALLLQINQQQLDILQFLRSDQYAELLKQTKLLVKLLKVANKETP